MKHGHDAHPGEHAHGKGETRKSVHSEHDLKEGAKHLAIHHREERREPERSHEATRKHREHD